MLLNQPLIQISEFVLAQSSVNAHKHVLVPVFHALCMNLQIQTCSNTNLYLSALTLIWMTNATQSALRMHSWVLMCSAGPRCTWRIKKYSQRKNIFFQRWVTPCRYTCALHKRCKQYTLRDNKVCRVWPVWGEFWEMETAYLNVHTCIVTDLY